MVAILIALSLGAALLGLLALTQATMGTGFVGVACLLGILARIAQASEHNAEYLKRMKKVGAIPPR